jgi:hypothetical protein
VPFLLGLVETALEVVVLPPPRNRAAGVKERDRLEAHSLRNRIPAGEIDCLWEKKNF